MPRRKIPARKHHGIRDPLKQAEERFNKYLINYLYNIIFIKKFLLLFRIKDKIDNPPSNKDEQKISQSLQRFIKMKEAFKTKGKLPKKASHGIEDRPIRK